MDWHKKQKSVKTVWKPVSTQATSSNEEFLAKDVKVQTENPHVEAMCDEKLEVGVQVEVVNSSTSASTPDVQDYMKNVETISARVDLSSGEPAIEEESQEGATVSPNIKVDNIHLVKEDEKYSISVEVAASLIHFIKGKGGSTQKEIEGELGVKIIFPFSKKGNAVIIKGDSIESVTKASERIQVILEEAVKSPTLDYSHFISLPLAINTGLVDKLFNFQSSILKGGESSKDGSLVSESDSDTSDDGEADDNQLDGGDDVAVKLKLEDTNDRVKVEINKIPLISYAPKASKSSTLSDLGIDRSIFIKPKTFHLTVLMLKLWNKERIAAATEVLERVCSKVIDALENRPVSIRLKGLASMRGSLAKARVLYIPVEEIGGEDRLLRACQVIIDAYVEAGLVLEKDARQTLKLHATVMNARHRKRKIRTKRFDSFDARGIVKQYGSEEWGEYLIPEAHLSQRFFFDDSGYYHRCASIPFPENKQVD
ncbi:K Homology domain [Macleaya cordata]|uniref:K Homology domain n=1 Tax=Macleaya cordata TaxID=56857 RepID=A0A200QDQ6_MACCD|nr:K Homology domain [Macleaya cordata]